MPSDKSLNVWLVHLGEQTPLDEGSRPYRYGQLAIALAQRGHRVVRWAPTYDHYYRRIRGEAGEYAVAPGHSVQLVEAGRYQRTAGLARVAFHVRCALRLLWDTRRTSRPDVILCGTPAPEVAFALAWWAWRRGVPMIVDVRDVWPDALLRHFRGGRRLARPLAHLLWGGANSFALRAAAAVTGVSEEYVGWGVARAGRARTAQDRAFFIGAPSQEVISSVPEDARAFSCCFFGSLSEHFDFTQVIRAAEHLPHVVFEICGHGAAFEDLTRAAKRLHNLRIHGWLTPAALVAVAARCQVGLAPYAVDATMSSTNKIAEYLSFGLPVIGSLQGDAMDVVVRRGAGWRYDPKASNGLADALRNLRRLPEGSAPARGRARAVFGEYFDATVVSRGFADLVEEIGWQRAPTAGG